MRRNMILVISLLVLTAQAHAGTGINLYGLSWHPDRDEVERYDYQETHPGLGFQRDVMVGERSRLALEAGILDDSSRNLNFHGGLSYRHQAWGPLWAGAALFISGSKSDFDGEPVGALLPLATLVTDLGELSWTYVPDTSRHHDSGAVLMYATLFPWGRTPAGHGRGSPYDGLRRGLEFRLDPSDGLDQFRSVAFVFRQVDPAAGGFRVGIEYSGRIRDRDRSGADPDPEYVPVNSEEDWTSNSASVFWEALDFHGSAKRVRAVTGLGCSLGHTLISEYIADSSGYLRSTVQVGWSLGLRGSLGAEWRVAEDLVLTADTYGTLSLQRDVIDQRYESGRTYRTVTKEWGINAVGASLGLVLYYD